MANLTIVLTTTTKWWLKFAIAGLRLGVFFGFKPSNSFIEKLVMSAIVITVNDKLVET